jgi:hypothetical protein
MIVKARNKDELFCIKKGNTIYPVLKTIISPLSLSTAQMESDIATYVNADLMPSPCKFHIRIHGLTPFYFTTAVLPTERILSNDFWDKTQNDYDLYIKES